MDTSTRWLTLAALTLSPALSAHGHEQGASARYLGNEGVMIVAGDTRILFDAFYAESFDTYVLVPERLHAQLVNGVAPYDGIDAVFVSHVHGDHFSPEPALEFLRAHRAVPLFASHQVAEVLADAAGEDDSDLLEQLVIFDLAPGDEPVAIEAGSLLVEVVAIPHSGGARMADISNLSFRVTLDQRTTVIHMGDAGVDPVLFAGLQSYWDTRHANAVFPPYWFFGSDAGKRILSERIRADRSIGIHVPASAVGSGAQWREEAGGDLFTDPGEVRALSHRHAGAAPAE